MARLADIAIKIGSGATPRGGGDVYLPQRQAYALVRSQNVFDRSFDTSGLAFISDDDAAGLRGVELQEGDILLNITGDGVTFGRSCLAPTAVFPAVVNQHVSIVRVDKARAAPGFVLAFLTHPSIKHYIESFNAGGSRRAITKGHIESFVLPLPPLPEQRTIARMLGALDDKIELNRKTNETLEAMARELFKSWFVDFDPVRAKMDGQRPDAMDAETAALFPDSFEESVLGQVPKAWSVGRLEDLVELRRGHDLPASARRAGSVPIVSSGGISGTHDIVQAKAPGIVTGRYGTLGKVFLMDEDYWPLNTTLYSSDMKGNDPTYIFHALGGVEFEKYSDKGAVPGINRNHLHMEPMLLPPLDVQRAFGTLVGAFRRCARALERQSTSLAQVRDALLPKLMSGELRVPGAAGMVEATT